MTEKNANKSSNEKLYRKLSEPRPPEEAHKDLAEFFKSVRELREKHGIADYVIAIGLSIQADDQAGRVMTWDQVGDRHVGATLAAYACGQLQKMWENEIAKYLAGGTGGKEPMLFE